MRCLGRDDIAGDIDPERIAQQLSRRGDGHLFALNEQVFADQPNIFKRAQSAGAALEAATKQPPEKRAIAIAEALGISVTQAKRDVAYARTWLAQQLASHEPDPPRGGLTDPAA